jgi:hypothetical protein
MLAHILSCQTMYSLNLIKGMVRTDGEAIERGWSNINPIATSTWEMGPGSQHDILDNHFSDWNWHKVCNFGMYCISFCLSHTHLSLLGPLLLQKLKEAIPECDQHIFDLQDFEEAIPPASLAAWQVMITEWEQDQSKPNPFKSEASGMYLKFMWVVVETHTSLGLESRLLTLP